MNPTSAVLSELELRQMILSVLMLLFFAQTFGHFFEKFYMPRVVGEIMGGVILGPSILGLFFPEYYNYLFNFFPSQYKILSFFSWMGLILLMLSAGFKISNLLNSGGSTLVFVLIVSSTIIPMIGGIIYCYCYDFNIYKGMAANTLSVDIIVCISIAITSIPIISKIFIDLDIINSAFSKIVIIAAVVHDLILWIGFDAAIKSTEQGYSDILLSTISTVLFFVVSLYISKYLSKYKYVNYLRNIVPVKILWIRYIIGLCLFFVFFTSFFKVHIIFGSLMTGLMVGSIKSSNVKLAREAISEFSLAFFIPIYFAIVGSKINLPADFDLKLFLVFLFISSALEIGSVTIGLRLLRMSWLTSLNFGMAMNTRGGPGIVIASMAYEFSIINGTLFVTLVLVAIVTSIISGTWFRFVLDKNLLLYKDSDKKLIISR